MRRGIASAWMLGDALDGFWDVEPASGGLDVGHGKPQQGSQIEIIDAIYNSSYIPNSGNRMASATFSEVEERDRSSTDRSQTLYASTRLAAVTDAAKLVSINISISAGSADLAPLREAVVATVESHAPVDGAPKRAVREALKIAAADVFNTAFAVEIKGVVDAYRVMLRESLAKGEDPQLQTALNRARLQERVLAGTSMVDQGQACELLGLSSANPSATMKRKEDRHEVLRFTVDGRATYPLFQFDVEGRRLFPAMAQLIAKKPKAWSDFRLLHWLTRPHLDLNGTPAEALGAEEEIVLAAFEREIEPAVHG